MKGLVGGSCFAIIVCFYCNLYAQIAPSAIRGKILTGSHAPAGALTVVLLKARDSTIVNSTITNNDGIFQFTGLTPNSYLISVSNIGYKKAYSGPYRAMSGKTLTIADITLASSVQELKEISVVASKPAIEVRPGRVILNVQNSIMAAGSSAYDILRDSPGVRVDNNNNISISGRQNALITVDGKPTNLSGDDLTSILRGMQSSTIDHIELITGGSAKYDASAGGVINIVLKKGQNLGTNGTFTASAGYGKYYKSNASIVFNSREDKFNIFGNYAYTDDKTFHDFVTDRMITYNNTLSDYHVDYNSVQKTYNNVFSLGTDYYLSSKHTIGFLVSGIIRDDDHTKDNNLRISNQHVLDSIITANSTVGRHVSDITYNVNYNGKLNSAGETLTANFDYTDYDRSSAEYITNNFYDPSGNAYHAPELLQNLSPSTIHMWLAKVDYTDPISKNTRLEAGLKYSDVISNNDLIFGPLKNGVYQVDTMFTNHFVYTENVNSAYVNIQNKFGKFNLMAGLRAEQTNTTGNSITLTQVVKNNYLDFFPHVLLTFSSGDKKDFSLSYSRGITRPLYQEINPFLYYIDVYDYSKGNPYLKPQYSNSLELSYVYNKTITTTLYTNIVNDAYNFNFYEQSDSTKKNIDTHVNFGSIYNYGIRFYTPVVFTSWWNASFSVDAAYQRYVAYPQYGNLNKGTQDIIFNSTQYFVLSNTITAEISGKYETPSFYGINQYKSYYNVNAGIGKQLFNKRGSIRLYANDIFNTIEDRRSTNYENLNIKGTDKTETQWVRLTFTYRFGKTSVKASAPHNTGNQDEQERTKALN